MCYYKGQESSSVRLNSPHEAANAKDGAVPILLTLPKSAANPRRSRRKC